MAPIKLPWIIRWLLGGRTRTRTLDPLIKRHQVVALDSKNTGSGLANSPRSGDFAHPAACQKSANLPTLLVRVV